MFHTQKEEYTDDDVGGGINSGQGEQGKGNQDQDVGTEATLCRAPTIACLERACGKAGTQVAILWEGFGCQAAAPLNITFSCRFGGLEVPAVEFGDGGVSSSSLAESEWDDREELWGPDWVGEGGEGAGIVCEVPKLAWVEEGQEQAVMVPVDVLWSIQEQVITLSLFVSNGTLGRQAVDHGGRCIRLARRKRHFCL